MLYCKHLLRKICDDVTRMTPNIYYQAVSRTANHLQFCQVSVANTKHGQAGSATSLQPIMAHLSNNTTNKIMMMMTRRMIVKIKLITCFKYHTITMY
jgi:hypothetical protein